MKTKDAFPKIKDLAHQRFADGNPNKVGISHIQLREEFGLTDSQITEELLPLFLQDGEFSGQHYLGDILLWRA